MVLGRVEKIMIFFFYLVYSVIKYLTIWCQYSYKSVCTLCFCINKTLLISMLVKKKIYSYKSAVKKTGSKKNQKSMIYFFWSDYNHDLNQ